MSRWQRLPPITDEKMHGNPCLNCPDPRAVLPPQAIVAVGFGDAHLEKDGEVLWDENQHGQDLEREEMMSCAKAEEMAAADPDHDWRIVLHGPMHGETYQRQDGQWVCVEQNEGFTIMSIITNPETNQPQADDNEFAWSRLSAIYLEGNDQIRIKLYFHPIHKPLKFYLNGEEAVLMPIAKIGGD